LWVDIYWSLLGGKRKEAPEERRTFFLKQKIKTVVAGALGECVHVAGVNNFLRLAEAAGWRTVFLGPAVSVEEMISAAQHEDADLVGVSYRLTPETGERLIGEFAEAASSLGIRARTSLEWLKLVYNTSGVDLHEAIHNQPGYYGINAPATLNHRYIFEDVPMSLVPIASIGKRYGVSVRGMESMIQIASFIHRTDYWRRGRTVEKLGLEQWDVSELTRFVQDGTID
jgi:hypothetical protein